VDDVEVVDIGVRVLRPEASQELCLELGEHRFLFH
jgi:hypothetical protein